jgi:hypothetical protein
MVFNTGAEKPLCPKGLVGPEELVAAQLADRSTTEYAIDLPRSMRLA